MLNLMNNIIIPEKLSEILLKNWANFLNKKLMIQKVLEDAKNANLILSNETCSKTQTYITITKFELIDNSNFEIWVEFGVPQQDNFIVGTHCYCLTLDGNIILKNTIGMIFQNTLKHLTD